MKTLILSVAVFVISLSTSLRAQNEAPKPDDKKPATPLIEFRKAWYENDDGRVESNFKQNGRALYLEPKAQITEADVKSVKLVPDPLSDLVNIQFELTEAGAKKMRTLTKDHIKNPLAILVKGQVVIAPTIQEPIASRIEISGLRPKEDSEALVKAIQKQIDERK